MRVYLQGSPRLRSAGAILTSTHLCPLTNGRSSATGFRMVMAFVGGCNAVRQVEKNRVTRVQYSTEIRMMTLEVFASAVQLTEKVRKLEDKPGKSIVHGLCNNKLMPGLPRSPLRQDLAYKAGALRYQRRLDHWAPFGRRRPNHRTFFLKIWSLRSGGCTTANDGD